jgi:hypothetical protein
MLYQALTTMIPDPGKEIMVRPEGGCNALSPAPTSMGPLRYPCSSAVNELCVSAVHSVVGQFSYFAMCLCVLLRLVASPAHAEKTCDMRTKRDKCGQNRTFVG